jgi:hypothetical protein
MMAPCSSTNARSCCTQCHTALWNLRVHRGVSRSECSVRRRSVRACSHWHCEPVELAAGRLRSVVIRGRRACRRNRGRSVPPGGPAGRRLPLPVPRPLALHARTAGTRGHKAAPLPGAAISGKLLNFGFQVLVGGWGVHRGQRGALQVQAAAAGEAPGRAAARL